VCHNVAVLVTYLAVFDGNQHMYGTDIDTQHTITPEALIPYVASGYILGGVAVFTLVVSLILVYLLFKGRIKASTGQRVCLALQAVSILGAAASWSEARPSEFLIHFTVPIAVTPALIGPSHMRGVLGLSLLAVVVVIILAMTSHSYDVDPTANLLAVLYSVPHAFSLVGFTVFLHRDLEQKSRLVWLLHSRLRSTDHELQSVLSDLLPEDVAAKILENPRAHLPPEKKEVVALHLDLCNFTHISQTVTPLKLIRAIHEVFSEFDDHLMLHGLFKVDTIGDAYVAVGFLPSSCSYGTSRGKKSNAECFHACQSMMHVARLMLTTLSKFRKRRDIDLRCRIGISRGSVFAGVLGTLQPRYQLLGKPMRVAEELEGNSMIDGVHVSEEVVSVVVAGVADLEVDYDHNHESEDEAGGPRLSGVALTLGVGASADTSELSAERDPVNWKQEVTSPFSPEGVRQWLAPKWIHPSARDRSDSNSSYLDGSTRPGGEDAAAAFFTPLPSGGRHSPRCCEGQGCRRGRRKGRRPS